MNNETRRADSCGIAAATATVVLAGIGYGNAAIAQDDSLVLEEIVVTAQRREENLQDVPISVTAYGAEGIEKSVIKEGADYLMMTPNVGYSEDGEGGSRSLNISIRGVSNITLDGIATANSIGYYLDELSVGSVAQGTINPQLHDMERIEILRGPQGTYYGRNAVGGAINMTTKKPDEDPYWEASGFFGNFDTWGLEAIGNLPISDGLMARAVVAHEQSDTGIENINPVGNDPFYEYRMGRLAIRALVTDATTFDLSIAHTLEDEGGDISIPSGILDLDTISIFGFPSADAAIDTGPGFYPQNDSIQDRDTRERNEKDFTIFNARITTDFDNMQFKSITGYVDSAFVRESDLDGISLEIGPLPLRRFNDYDARAFSQEFRLQSAGDSNMDWTVGAYYAKDEFERVNQIQILAKGAPSGPPVGFINSNVGNFDFETTALFGEVTWHASDTVDLVVGGRFSQDDITASEIDFNRGPAPLVDSVDDTNFSPRAVLRYMPGDDMTWYGSVSKGYKAGGTDVSGGSRTVGAPFEAEDLISYEIGFKSRLADGRVALNGAVFALDWDDFQVQTNRLEDPNDISSAISTTQNAEAASAFGVEAEFMALLAEDVTVGLNVGYLDSEFDDYRDAVLKGETNGLPNVIDVTGQVLPRSPEWTYSANFDWGFDVGANADGFFHVDWAYTDEQYSDIEAIGSLVGETVNGDAFNLPDFPYRIDSYSVVNVSAGIEWPNFRIGAYVKNAGDEQYYTGTADNFGAAGIRLKPHFRTWGIRFTYMSN